MQILKVHIDLHKPKKGGSILDTKIESFFLYL